MGVASAALLAGARWLDGARASAAGLQTLGPRDVQILEALAPVVLEGALPQAAGDRDAALREVVEAFDRAVSRLGRPTREEIGELFALLGFAPTRILVAGLWPEWRQAQPAEVAAFLEDWRTSGLALKRASHRALTQLIQAAWYDQPAAWRITGYPGPPPVSDLPR